MKKEIRNNIIDYFVKELKKKLNNHLKQIILFGSRARGDETFDSDYDCLIVVDDVSNKIKNIIDETTGKTLFKYNAVISAFPYSEKELKSQKYNPFLLNIEREGILL